MHHSCPYLSECDKYLGELSSLFSAFCYSVFCYVKDYIFVYIHVPSNFIDMMNCNCALLTVPSGYKSCANTYSTKINKYKQIIPINNTIATPNVRSN